MKIWRMYLLPHDKHENEFGFCYQRGIIGIGWQVCQPNEPAPSEIDDYLDRMKTRWENEKDAGGWDDASRTIAQNMSVGDLVWIRNHRGDPDRFCLGKITCDWEYRNGDEYRCADIVSIRECKFHEVRAADVGGDAAGFFKTMKADRFRLGRTVEPIEEEGLKQHTIAIWKKIQSEI